MVRVTLREATATMLIKAVNSYLQNYHPMGYGTMVTDLGVDRENYPDKPYWASISRGSTAD
jgi:hypothetical protein